MPREATSDARARRDVLRIAAQKATAGWELRSVDNLPAAVALVIVDFRSFCLEPARRIRGHCLLACSGRVGGRRGGQGAACRPGVNAAVVGPKLPLKRESASGRRLVDGKLSRGVVAGRGLVDDIQRRSRVIVMRARGH
eukprot:170237-Pleurochrysis_carterae.AAC.1